MISESLQGVSMRICMRGCMSEKAAVVVDDGVSVGVGIVVAMPKGEGSGMGEAWTGIPTRSSLIFGEAAAEERSEG